jgi:kinesin family protein 1/kinesin family protein 3/17
MEDESEVGNVVVAVRCRPMSSKELGEGQTPIATFPPGGEQVTLESKGEPHNYQFDHVFSPTVTQDHIFDTLGVPLLSKAFDGYNSTIFAYGQTGSGKTHTMMNHRGGPTEKGLIPRINAGLFERIKKDSAENESRRFLVCCSFLEIYNEVIYDLLVPKSKQTKGGGLEIREQKGIGVYVKDLTEVVVEGSDKLNQLIEQGFEHRSTAATKMNDVSSRSHCIFVIKLHQKDAQDDSKNTFSKVNLVDLAGSERAKSTEAEGDRLKEGANINKSLSALGNVINALSTSSTGNKKVFVPYRNSKLTRVLQESLGGNSLCTMVAAMSPANANSEETLSTLNYARRAKTIKVTATKNEEASQIRKLEDEVSALKAKLESQAVSSANASMSTTEKGELESKYVNQIEELQSFMKQSWQDKQNLSEQYELEHQKAIEEAAKAAELVTTERRKRLQLLESKGDLEFSLQGLSTLDHRLVHGWPDMISDALLAEKTLRSQVHAVRLFRDSASTDFNLIWSKNDDDTILGTLLTQAHTKLGSMKKELEELTRLERQFEERMGEIGPKVGLALREAKDLVASKDDTAGANQTEEELADMVGLVQRQMIQHHEKVRAFLKTERTNLGFSKELHWLIERLDTENADKGNAWKLVKAFKEALQVLASGSSGSGEGADEVPKALGLSTLSGLMIECLLLRTRRLLLRVVSSRQSPMVAGVRRSTLTRSTCR